MAEKLPVNPSGWSLYPGNLLKSVAGYLASNLQFSGASNHSAGAVDGRLTMSGNNMILSSHDISLDFEDSVSQRNGGESESLAFRYSFPVAGVHVRMAVEDSEYLGVSTKAGQQLDARGEHHGLTLSGSRALWSWQGFEVDSVFRHSNGKTHTYEESVWVSDATHQFSSFGLRYSGKRELAGGFRAGSSITALGGWETIESVSTSVDSSEETGFHKIALGASLSRTFYRWDLGLDGRYQLAPEDLAAAEYLQIAGPSMMRGFNGQSLYVSEGGWVRMNARSPGYSIPFTRAVNSYVMVSVLRGWASTSAADNGGFGASTGEISLTLQGRRFLANMSVGQILDLSGDAMQRPARPDVSFSMTLGI
ncbi:ShlB/FhaC/HecB family hemolysin secretion/activation protein [Marinobacter sp. F3R08]|uniref:ShlB/FhaC/HecB family hemolysin secretion/activation protein n=1 Tax=Marinobacter sp. F3R08 TaxID=2841559 RepID=UPI001C093C94|nr:ShlB/FhaC/HecB family hemolysin secretion/activation protein [Marinobacter sp. F3R08]MBU2955581.1 hypothetical protein [Marinobacter sp. F3R08]